MTASPDFDHRDGVRVRRPVFFKTASATRWYAAPRGWNRDDWGVISSAIKIGMARNANADGLPKELIIAITADVHHIRLTRKQTAALAALLQRRVANDRNWRPAR